jgi:hypothetical protein
VTGIEPARLAAPEPKYGRYEVEVGLRRDAERVSFHASPSTHEWTQAFFAASCGAAVEHVRPRSLRLGFGTSSGLGLGRQFQHGLDSAAGSRDSHPIGGQSASRIVLLDEHELAAGKLAALVARSASRDLFDARELLRVGTLETRRLRLGFVVYGGINRVDWRSITIENVTTTAAEVDSQLVPMLRQDVRPARAGVGTWTNTLVRETRELMSAVLPLAERELEFLDRLNDAGDIVPSLLTDDPTMIAIIQSHPGLQWKAQNVKKHGADADEPKT